MDSTAGAVIASSAMLSSTAVVVTGLVWLATGRARERRHADLAAAAVQQRELRAEVAELTRSVGAMQRLLEGAD
ncbi:hypothetical protein [Streptomyces sp. NPDC089799]|uniref:hypothetical protein n=1 Tax=Streptomyces sp. NPDC089799 TaxID=3155066 RepID=UPI00343DF115